MFSQRGRQLSQSILRPQVFAGRGRDLEFSQKRATFGAARNHPAPAGASAARSFRRPDWQAARGAATASRGYTPQGRRTACDMWVPRTPSPRRAGERQAARRPRYPVLVSHQADGCSVSRPIWRPGGPDRHPGPRWPPERRSDARRPGRGEPGSGYSGRVRPGWRSRRSAAPCARRPSPCRDRCSDLLRGRRWPDNNRQWVAPAR